MKVRLQVATGIACLVVLGSAMTGCGGGQSSEGQTSAEAAPSEGFGDTGDGESSSGGEAGSPGSGSASMFTPDMISCPTTAEVSAVLSRSMYLREPASAEDESYTSKCIYADSEESHNTTVAVFVAVYSGEVAEERASEDFWVDDGWTVGGDERLPDGAFLAEKPGACYAVWSNLSVDALSYQPDVERDECGIARDVLVDVMAASRLS